MEQRQLYERLVERYVNNTASKEELEVFFHLLQKGELDPYLEKLSFAKKEKLQPIGFKETKKLAFKASLIVRYSVAASLILFLSAGVFLYFTKGKKSDIESQTAAQIIPQAFPGTKKAILILSDGKRIALDNLHQTIRQGATTVVPQNNALVYKADKTTTTVLYNTITTPRGGEYGVTLPDGTNVWLNAGTSLRYPTAFIGAERRVELIGEAYFEVAKNAKQPFIVQAAGTETKVLGTQFNVMAYDDEGYMKTTLAEGSVLLRKSGHEEKLVPGEGGIINNGSDKIVVAAADVEQDLAWRSGFFQFDKTGMETIIKQIGRWYDLDIRYVGSIPQNRFVGRISRNTNLSDVLDILRLSDVHFSMAGKTLIVKE